MTLLGREDGWKARCGDVLADLRAALDEDKAQAIGAGLGVEPVLATLRREFLEA